MEMHLILKLKDPISCEYHRYYHLVLLLVWLFRYIEYLLTTSIECQQLLGEFGAQLVDDVLLGVLVVLFLPAWIYRSWDTPNRSAVAVYATLFVEMLLEIALVLYYVSLPFVDEKSRTFALVGYHAVWMFHLSLIIYKLLVLFVSIP